MTTILLRREVVPVGWDCPRGHRALAPRLGRCGDLECQGLPGASGARLSSCHGARCSRHESRRGSARPRPHRDPADRRHGDRAGGGRRRHAGHRGRPHPWNGTTRRGREHGARRAPGLLFPRASGHPASGHDPDRHVESVLRVRRGLDRGRESGGHEGPRSDQQRGPHPRDVLSIQIRRARSQPIHRQGLAGRASSRRGQWGRRVARGPGSPVMASAQIDEMAVATDGRVITARRDPFESQVLWSWSDRRSLVARRMS